MSTPVQEAAVLPESAGNEVAKGAWGLTKRVEELDKQIKQFSEIATPSEYEQVARYGLLAAGIIKDAEAFYADEVGRLYKLWKDKVAERGAITTPAENIKQLASRLCGSWQQEQERKRKEEELRQQQEQLRLAETQVIEEAAQLEREGRADEAQALIEAPVAVAPVSVPTAVPKVQGVSKPRVTYKAEVVSLSLLVKAVAEGKVPLQMLQANQSALDSMARTLREELRYPGVKVVSTAKAAYRG